MPKPRVLSDFLAKELLYDYLNGQLDEARKDALEKAIKESEDVSGDLKSLKEGLKFCEALRNTKLSEPYFQFLSQPPKTLRDRTKGWGQVKPAVRYSIEASAMLLVFLLLGLFTPKQYRFWEADTGFTVVEFKKEKPAPIEDSDQATAGPVSTTTVVDVEAPVKAKTVFGPPTTLVQMAEGQMPKAEVKVETAKNQAVAPATPVVVKSASAPQATAPARKGEIIRLTLQSAKVDEWTPQVTDKILSLGGAKAGEVQLGWRRKGGSYFHFSMPETNFETLKDYLQTLGPVRIVREPHPRVMPEGTIRLILWLEQGSGTKTYSDGNEGKDN